MDMRNKKLLLVAALILSATGVFGAETTLSPHNVGLGWSLDLNAAYYMRKTHYKFHDDVRSETYEVRIGLTHTI